MTEAEKNQISWAKRLKTGDMAPNCDYKICTISEVKHYYSIILPKLLVNLNLWLPSAVSLYITNLCLWIAFKIGSRQLIDINLKFTDGTSCSAICCCYLE